MVRLSDRIAALSPEQRAVLEGRLADVAGFGTTGSGGVPGPVASRIAPRGADIEDLPLSYAQERLWFLEQLQPMSSVYSIPGALPWVGPLSVGALKRALDEIVRRHESLRTTFDQRGGRPWQRVAPPFAQSLPVIDLVDHPRETLQTDLTRLASEEARQPFDLVRGPLLRTTLVRVQEDYHILFINIHHIIADEWSLGVLYGELTTLYQGLCAGRMPTLPELAVQYPDFALWQREHLSGETLDELLRYWRHRLEGAAPALGLPTDRARPPASSGRGRNHAFRLGAGHLELIKSVNHRFGVTTFMTLLACFNALLFRYCGQQDITIGVPIANRSLPEVEPLIGFFVNTLAMRSRVRGEARFLELLAEVKEVTLGAFAHQDLPFAKLVAELAPRRDLGVSPLFQVMFSMLTAPTSPAGTTSGNAGEMQTSDVQPPPMETGTAKFDLTLAVMEQPDGLGASFEYATDLFDAGTIERMAGHFTRLVEAACACPELRVAELPILSEAEREQLLVGWNRTAAERPQHLCIHHLCEQQVDRAPDAVAVTDERQSVTYEQLDQRANQLAWLLIEHGAGPEVPIGICMRPCIEAILAMLAVLKAGSAYVPLDPDHPAERIRQVVEGSRLGTVLTQPDLADRGPFAGRDVLVLGGDEDPAEHCSIKRVDSPVVPENLAYIVYTSGSTGGPKGVMVPHAGICNGLIWAQGRYPLGRDDSVLQQTSFCFDVSVWEIFWTLSAGARLVIASPEEHRDIGRLVRAIAEQRITVVYLVSSMMTYLLQARGLESCSGLRLVIQTGEQMSSWVPQRLFQRLSCRLINLYGPTETSVEATFWEVPEDHDPACHVPIGTPIANTRVYILDPALQPVPIGVVGEAYIGGVNLARGYVGRPAQTAGCFVPSPFDGVPGERLYQSGDLGRLLPDGDIQLLGRKDFQVKLRGFRIELGEIEVALALHPGVRQSVLLAREDIPGDQRLVAYVVPAERPGVDEVELRRYLASRLPDYMVPSVFVRLDELPCLSNGKVNRHALPVPNRRHRAGDEADETPLSAEEAVMAGIWCQVLALDRVGAEDDFFELGGHSLLATVVVSRLRDLYGVELTVRSVFEAPTIRDLSARVSELVRLQRDARAERAEGDEPADLAARIPGDHPVRAIEDLDQLSDEQVDQLLEQMLAARRDTP